MKLKTDDSGHPVIADGKPVYVHEDGKEVPFDAPAAVTTIKRISDERDELRRAAEQAAERLKAWDGVDPEVARKALQTVADLEKGDLLTADKVDQLRREIGDSYKSELEKVKTDSATALKRVLGERDALQAKLDRSTLGAAFAGSKFVKQLAYPADVAQTYFGHHFKIAEDGSIEARDAKGNAITSIERPGEKAGFEEALGILVNGLPNKEAHLRAPDARGTEAGSPGRGAMNGRTKTRAEFNAMPAAGRMKFLTEGGALTD